MRAADDYALRYLQMHLAIQRVDDVEGALARETAAKKRLRAIVEERA